MNPILRALPALLGLALGTGCLSRPALVRESFLLPAPPDSATHPAPATNVLALHQLDVAEPFAGKAFVYRTGAFSYEMDPYAEFIVPPARMLHLPLAAHLRTAGVDLVEPGSPRRPTRHLDLVVTELYGEFRAGPAPAAVVTMHVSVSDTASDPLPRVLLQKTYAARVPVETRTASVLAAAWNTGITQLLAEIAADVRSTTAAP